MKKNILIIIPIIILSIILLGCNNILTDSYQYDDTNYKIGNMAFTEPITQINIDWIVGDVIITKSETQEIIIREDVDANIDDSLKMHYNLSNGILDVKFCGNKESINHSYRVKKLYVYLPSMLKKITLNNKTADITINNVIIMDLSINNISGDIDMQKSEIDLLNINNTSGSILLFYNSLNYVNINTISGNVGISCDYGPLGLNVTSESAGITIYIKENEMVSFNYETEIGTFKTNLEYTTNNNTYIFNNGSTVHNVKTQTGYFKVLKK